MVELTPRGSRVAVGIARSLALLWAGWWLFFGLACSISEGAGAVATVVHMAVPGGVFLAVALIGGWWRRGGTLLLSVAGIVICVAYPALMADRLPVLGLALATAILGLPPLVAGLLLLFAGRAGR